MTAYIYLRDMDIWNVIKDNPQVGAHRLIAEYGNRLYAAALILVHESHAAEDLVARTIRQAMIKIRLYDEKYSFWNWLYIILLNFHRSDLRKNKAEVANSADFFENNDFFEYSTDSDLHLSNVDAELMREAVARLHVNLREVVMLRYFEDKTLAEIEQILKLPLGTVKNRLHRARISLNAILFKMFTCGDKGK